ncbi:uncharacterized protein BDV14DRAFT_184579, partial [Aspergillus stella-maris]|uniref:uncharacterized protein n=1 Tax=Aspergillus stella-maris TaxID=1810926 RepID=UPI003CCD2C00
MATPALSYIPCLLYNFIKGTYIAILTVFNALPSSVVYLRLTGLASIYRTEPNVVFSTVD